MHDELSSLHSEYSHEQEQISNAIARWQKHRETVLCSKFVGTGKKEGSSRERELGEREARESKEGERKGSERKTRRRANKRKVIFD